MVLPVAGKAAAEVDEDAGEVAAEVDEAGAADTTNPITTVTYKATLEAETGFTIVVTGVATTVATALAVGARKLHSQLPRSTVVSGENTKGLRVVMLDVELERWE